MAIDMSLAYIKGVRENFANAQLVFDKFHVIQEANEGVEAVRLLESQQDELKRAQLAKSQWIFRKNPETHTEKETARLAGDGLATFDDRAGVSNAPDPDIYKLPDTKQAREQRC